MLLKRINRILGYIAGSMIFFTSAIMLYDVFCRYVLGAPSVWAQSISQILILAATFLGTSYCMQSGGHVNVEVIVDRVKPLPRRILMTVGYLLAMTFLGALLKACLQYALDAYHYDWDIQGNLPVPAVLLYGIMVIGTAMLIITIIAQIYYVWTDKTEIKEAVN